MAWQQVFIGEMEMASGEAGSHGDGGQLGFLKCCTVEGYLQTFN